MRSRFFFNGVMILGILLFFSGCDTPAGSKNSDEQNAKMEEELQEKPVYEKAVCILHPTEGNETKGTITFTRTDSGVKIVADIEGLSEGKHGFHIHEYGDCSDPEGKSAGGHFDPDNKEHGAPDDEDRHVGDLGNVIAGEDGKAHYERVDNVIELNGNNSIIGRAIIVHAGEDDLVSQPIGDAGARLACGVIGIEQ